jgi:Bacterial PH domain
MRREFAVTPPDPRLVMLMPALSLIAVLATLSFEARDEPRMWLIAIPIVLIVGLLAWSIQRRRVTIDDDRLRIAGSMHTTTVRAAELDLDAARIVDLAEAKALRPRFNLFGTSIPGFHAGHFRLRNRARAFVLLTGRSKVLALPERSGRMLLLSLEKPQALLDTLKAVATDNRRR